MALVMTERLRFGANYREEITLRDGSRVLLRPILPSDKQALRDAFARLGPDSRYHRFLSLRPTLTEEDLRYYTEVDGVDHFCIAALAEQDDGPRGVGTARFVRDASDPTLAEPAVTVVDEWQNRGLGKQLAMRLMWAASERGIKRFRSTVLASNVPIRHLMSELAPDTVIHAEGPLLICDFPVPQDVASRMAPLEGADQDRWDAMRRFLRLAAREFRG